MDATIPVLDHGYIALIETWGSDEAIVSAARMSTQKGFLGWGPMHRKTCVSRGLDRAAGPWCDCDRAEPGDEKLLRYLWDHQHATPFEFAGMTVEAKLPIVVAREWVRHRIFGFNEMSARYVPLPDENYVPDASDVLLRAHAVTANKQAQGTGRVVSAEDVDSWLASLSAAYEAAQVAYELGVSLGVPKELARLSVPVGRYTRWRATTNLRGWLSFLKLRCDKAAQQEIRLYANAVAALAKAHFPRTYEVARESVGMP